MQTRNTLWAAWACLFALFLSLPARAFDEDHKETINGTTLHFRVRGADKANPYLLILHGGPGFSAHMFYTWGPSLEKTLNVVYLDQRGSGESAHVPVANPQDVQPAEVKGYTVAALLADVEGVRQSLHVDRWYVLGHSWGGMLGLEYVAAHPEHVLGYVHMDGLVSVPAMETGMLDAAQAKFQTAGPSATAADKAMLADVSRLRALPPTDPSRLEGLFRLAMGPAGLYFARDPQTAFMAFNTKIAAAVKPYGVPFASLMPTEAPAVGLMVNDHYLTRDDTPLLPKITVPTLVINGKQDGVITPVEAEAAHAGIKGSQIVLLDDCGHFPFAEQPEATTAAILAFVKAQTPTAPAKSAGDTPGPSRPMLPMAPAPQPGSSKQIIATWTVDEQGRVQDIKFRSSGDKEIDNFIRADILSKTYTPPTRDGKPVPVEMRHTYDFR